MFANSSSIGTMIDTIIQPLRSGRSWISAHLYYGGPLDDFLREGISGFLERRDVSGIVDSFFFVRYWERGPHIRLRLSAKEYNQENEIRDLIRSFFNDHYFKNNPSRRDAFIGSDSSARKEYGFLSDCVQFIDYMPETERYGGNIGVLIAEEHFKISSKAVLSYLRTRLNGTDYGHKLGVAIFLQMSCISCLGYDPQNALDFWNRILLGWLNRKETNGIIEGSGSRTVSKSRLMDYFKECYAKDKGKMSLYVQHIQEYMLERRAFTESWKNDWVEGNRLIGNMLREAFERKELNFVGLSQQGEGAPDNMHRALQSIVASYLHMTNNRLGIRNIDEVYLGFVMSHLAKFLLTI